MQLLAGRRLYAGAISFLLGAVAVQAMAQLPPTGLTLSVAAVGACLCFAMRSLRPWSWFLVGFAWTVFRADLILERELPHALEGKDLVVEGVVTSLVQRRGAQLKFIIKTQSIASLGEHSFPQSKALLRWYHADQDVRHGQRWRMTVRLKRPHGFQNPGGFDYEKWLFRHKIRATGYVRTAEQLPVINSSAWWGRYREYLQRYLRDSELVNEGLIRALVIGDRSGVSDLQRKALVRTGTLHLLAISGLHIGLVAGFCFVLGGLAARILGPGLLWLPAPLSGALWALLGGGLYALLAGLTLPTQRAFIMVTAVMAALMLRRSVDIVRCLAIALILILIAEPLSVLDAGFWLSFGAVSAILLASRLTRGIGGRINRLILVQLLLSVLLAPLVLMLFGQVSIIAPVANLLAIPVVGLTVVPLVLLGSVVLGFGWMSMAATLYRVADYILGTLLSVLHAMAEPGWAVWASNEPYWLLALLLVGLVAAVTRFNRASILAAFLCLMLFLATERLLKKEPLQSGDFELTMLDVGQGLSIVVRTRNHALLYDTGARFGPGFDAGAAVVVPYLRHKGINFLDMLIISHGDNDHIGGMESVLQAIEVGRRLTSVPDRVPDSTSCKAGDEWVWDEVRFAVLSPEIENPPEHNNASCVVKVVGQSGSTLITGDIEREVEARLLAEEPIRLRSDVLIVPHQGSKTSSTSAFIDQVAPGFAVVSAGYRNRYGHPAETVLKRYRDRNIDLLNTARDGAVTVRIAGRGIHIEAFRTSQRRFWFDDDRLGPSQTGPARTIFRPGGTSLLKSRG